MQVESRAQVKTPGMRNPLGSAHPFPVPSSAGQPLACFKLEKMLKVPHCLLLFGALLPDRCAGQTQLLLGPAPFLTPLWQLTTLTEAGISLGITAKILLWAVVRLHPVGSPDRHVSDTHPRHHDSATQ